MEARQLKIGRLFGVEIGLHVSWLFIAALILLSLAQRFRGLHPQWDGALVWLTAGATSVLFFGALVLHELSHALVARSRGIPVRSITLFALGGVARIEKESEEPATEFWIGIAGPAASAAIGGVCLGIASLFGWGVGQEPPSPALAVLVWLGYINVSLALFNLVPAYPMDGGRILRAALWWWKRDVVRATRWAARAGQAVAVAFVLLGALNFLAGAGVGSLWIACIGFFLWRAAAASQGQVELAELLRGVRVGDVMRRDCLVVDGYTNLRDFVEKHVLPSGNRCFVVEEAGATAGLVTLDDVKLVPRPRWPYTTIDDVMQPLHLLQTVSPSAPLSESVEILGGNDLLQLAVVEGDRLLGVITRGRIVQFLRTRAELQV